MMTTEMETVPLSSDDEVQRNKLNGSFQRNSSGSALQPEHSIDGDDAEEKARLIEQVYQLQNTLDDLAQRVDAVKDENVKLKSENQILGQYIENLMAASSVFQGNSKGKSKMSHKADLENKNGSLDRVEDGFMASSKKTMHRYRNEKQGKDGKR